MFIAAVVVYFVIDSVRKLLVTSSYSVLAINKTKMEVTQTKAIQCRDLECRRIIFEMSADSVLHRPTCICVL
jgi:hypothetical protein